MSSVEVILGNSNKRFSGVTSTMLGTLPEVRKRIEVAVLGRHHLPDGVAVLTFGEMVRLCRDGKTRVFHARRNDEMIQALIAKKIFGAKIHIIFTSTAQRYHSKFTKWLMSKMDGILTTCSAAGSYLEKPADEMIPHGIDLEKYTPPASKEEAWNKLGLPGKYGVGIFGRVRPQKGVDLLVEAAIRVLKKNPDPTVVVVGETTPSFASFQSELEEKIKAAGLEDRFVFLGERPGEELPGLFQGMSLVAALSRNEGFGLTVIEAMAAGAAVLASRAGAWPDIVTDGEHGYLIPTDDLDATTEKLEALISSHADLGEMGRRGREHVEKNYSVSREAESLCRYYRRFLGMNK